MPYTYIAGTSLTKKQLDKIKIMEIKKILKNSIKELVIMLGINKTKKIIRSLTK